MGWVLRWVVLTAGLSAVCALACGQEIVGQAGPVVRATDSITVSADRGLVG
jgi:hypothetical protein